MAETLNDVPQSGQTLGFTQPLIRTNFLNIDTAFQQDHVPYTDTGQGKHNQITFPNWNNTSYTVLSTEIQLTNQNAAPTNVQDIWMKRGTGTAYPITGWSGANNPGWSYLPSGLIMKWGRNACPGTVTFLTSPPFSALVVNIQITANSSIGTGNIYVSNVTLTGFTLNNTGTSTTVYWFAIGA